MPHWKFIQLGLHEKIWKLGTALMDCKLLVTKAVFLHQEAQDNCCTSRYPSISMNKGFAACRKTTVQEVFHLLEVLNYVFCD